MSCSKFSTPTPATSIYACGIDMLQEIKKIKTRFGNGYTRTTEAFCISDISGETSYWLLQIFDTPNKKKEMKTCNAYLWRVLTNSKIESFTSTPVPYSMGDARVLSTISCPVAIDEMSGLPKALAGCFYTTNSLGALSSFSLTHDEKDPSCLEYYFNVVAKSELSRRQIASMPAQEVKEYMRTTRFISADALLDIVSDLDNGDRFHARALDDLSDNDRKAFNEELLRVTREGVAASEDHEDFKALVLRWIERNLQLPKTMDPVLYKEQIGRMLPLPDIAKWNEIAGLSLIVIASKLYKNSPVDLQSALPAGYGALVAEFTPKDSRYGVSFGKEELDEACKTPYGKIQLMKLLFKEHDRQETFIADLKAILEAPGNDELAKARAALHKLTHGIDEYGSSIHGLSRAILLRLIVGELKFPPLLHAEIVGCFRKIGLNWDIEDIPVYPIDEEDDSLDPFALLHIAGDHSHPMREGAGMKRSLSE